MRVEPLIALVLIAGVFTCAHDHVAGVAADTASEYYPAVLRERSFGAHLSDFDIVQRTCALEVVLRPIAWEGAIAFGDIDDTLVRPNADAEGTMLACAAPPALGDTARIDMR